MLWDVSALLVCELGLPVPSSSHLCMHFVKIDFIEKSSSNAILNDNFIHFQGYE